MRRLCTLALGLFLVLSLTGCENFRRGLTAVAGYTVTQGQLDAVRTSYNAFFLAPAANYAELPLCAKTQVATFAKPCGNRSVILALRAADAKVLALFNKVQAQINTGNNTGLVAAYQDLLTAIDTAQVLVTTFNMR